MKDGSNANEQQDTRTQHYDDIIINIEAVHKLLIRPLDYLLYVSILSKIIRFFRTTQ
jgi:hypothetical protein